MKSSASDLDSIHDLNAVALKEEELFKVIDDYNRFRDLGICPQMTGVIAETKVCEETPEKAKAILLRLQALSEIIEDDALKDWILADGIGVMPIIAHKAVVSAAADHPLSIINGDITFEKESFLRKILELAEPEGSHHN